MTPFALPLTMIPLKETKLSVKYFPKENDIVAVGGKEMKLFEKISEGGEGVIYKVSNNPSIVCKIYHPEKLTNLRKEKIGLMISKKIQEDGICWPIDLALNKYGEFVGYIMPAASGKTMQTSMFIKPQLLKNFPNFRRKDLVEIAISFLKKMKFLHSMNIIVGDINALNILVEPNGKIWFVDTDSYQIENFPCPVGTVNFTAPEIQGKDYAKFLRTKDHELFAIATMIFMILFPGKPPYSQQGGESQSDNIKKMNFPYWCSEKADVNPPEGSWNFIWSHLIKEMKNNFCLTFGKNQRRNIDEWIDALGKYRWFISKGLSTNELFPTGFYIRDPENTICDNCFCEHVNSGKKIQNLKQQGKDILCDKCLREIKLKILAKKSNVERTNILGASKANVYSQPTRRTSSYVSPSSNSSYQPKQVRTAYKYSSIRQQVASRKRNFLLFILGFMLIGGGVLTFQNHGTPLIGYLLIVGGLFAIGRFIMPILIIASVVAAVVCLIQKNIGGFIVFICISLALKSKS